MINKWWEVTVDAHSDLEETIFWRLEEIGCKGSASQIKDDSICVKGYLSVISIDVLDLAALSLKLRQDAILTNQSFPVINWQLIDEEDWSSSWKSHWQPMEIGDRLLINPAWLETPQNTDRIIIKLDPGSAFGTGVHQTTQLCLESLEMQLDGEDNSEMMIADIGCGSGILAIAASLFGVKNIYAVDNDLLAVKATNENSYLNNIDNINVVHGSIKQLQAMTDQKFDGIVCNILADVIKPMIPEMGEIIKPKGWASLSGIIVSQSIEIANILEQNGWVISSVWKRDDWCCLNARRDIDN